MSTDALFSCTDKQQEILNRVLQAVDRGEFLTLTRLWKGLSYGREVTKQAVKCSVHILRDHGYLEFVYGPGLEKKHRRGLKLYLKPTHRCYITFRSRPAPEI